LKKINLILVLILAFTLSLTIIAKADTTKLTAVDVTKGKYAGYQMLKGYDGEKDFRVYFKVEKKGSITSSVYTCVYLKKENMNQVFKWKYNGKTVKGTRKSLYELFTDTQGYRSESGKYSDEWYKATYGQVYEDWFAIKICEQDAEDIINEYLNEGNTYDRYSTADLVIPKSEWITDDELREESVLLSEHYAKKGFFRYNSLSGSVGDLIYAVPDYDGNFSGEAVFSEIRMKSKDGKLSFNKSDLISKGILKE